MPPLPFLVLVSISFLSSCSDPKSPSRDIPPEQIMATVDGEPISIDDLKTTAAKNGYDLYGVDGTENAMRDAINFELLAAEAEEAGYFDHPEVRKMVKGFAVQKLLAEKIDREIGNTVLTEDQLKAFYEKHKESEFSQPTLARGRVLHLMPEQKGATTLEIKKTKVEEALKANRPFAEVVKELSDNPSARVNGGDTNWLTEGEPGRRYLKEVQEALFALKTLDEITGPIETEKGLFWVQLSERREGRVTPFEEAKRNISQRVYRQQRLEAYDRYLEDLREGFEVREYPERLMSALEKESGKMRSAGPPMGPVSLPKGD